MQEVAERVTRRRNLHALRRRAFLAKMDVRVRVAVDLGQLHDMLILLADIAHHQLIASWTSVSRNRPDSSCSAR